MRSSHPIDQPLASFVRYFSTSSSQPLKALLAFVPVELNSDLVLISLPYCNSFE